MSRYARLRAMHRVVILGATGMFLAGCSETSQFSLGEIFSSKDEQGELVARAQTPTETIEQEVEAPDVFFAAENGLWDGRPSLGGIWVSHPDVKQPERVMIRNKDNGKFVVGALFRHERAQPGPNLRLSSDAAAALGMLAGAPTSVEVVALTKEKVPVEPAALAPVAELDTEEIKESEAIETAALDPIAAAAAAIDAAEPTPPEASLADATETAVSPKPELRPTAAVATDDVASKDTNADENKAEVSALTKPFLQVGIFSVEGNANDAAQSMRTAGMIPTVKTFEVDDKPYWRVVVGPAQTLQEQEALKVALSNQGFDDAYAVTN